MKKNKEERGWSTGERPKEYIEGLKRLKESPATLRIEDGTVITHYGDRITIVDKDGNKNGNDVPSQLMKFVDIKNVKYISLTGNREKR